MRQEAMGIKIQGNITVNSIERNSGIFIGQRNCAVGWSAHGKSNNIYDSIGDSNQIVQNLSLLIDPDMIDTPIDDRDQHIILETPDLESKITNIDLQAVNVNSIIQNAGVFVGKTTITGMESHEKSNTGSGDTYGEKNLSLFNQNFNFDPDMIDAIMNDQDFKPAFVQNIQK